MIRGLYRWFYLLTFTLWVLGCGDGEEGESTEADAESMEAEEEDPYVLMPDSATRMGPAKMDLDVESPVRLRLLTTREDCQSARVGNSEMDQCLPRVDRASGEVQLAIGFELVNGDHLPMPDVSDQLRIWHQGTGVEDAKHERRVEIPLTGEARNLFVLLMDGSQSMTQKLPGAKPDPNVSACKTLDASSKDRYDCYCRSIDTRLKKLQCALLSEEVADTFFPQQGRRAGVVLLQFYGEKGTEREPIVESVGGPLRVLDSKNAYRAAVYQLSEEVGKGWTPLYQAIQKTLDEVVGEESIQNELTEDSAVTLIALSDGFNNVTDTDICGDNVDRLIELEDFILDQQTDYEGGQRIANFPTIHTVGLGKPVYPNFNPRVQPNSLATREVKPRTLCGGEKKGGTFANRRIDGDLEEQGIDNASLAWIAAWGGGESYVRNSTKGLSEAFQKAAALRYGWFEVRYEHDPFYMRRKFKTAIELTGRTPAMAWVSFMPSAWLDGPAGVRDKDGWTRSRDFSHTLVLFVPLLSLMLVLSYWGVVSLHLRRGMLGRLRIGRFRVEAAQRAVEVGKAPPKPPPPNPQ